LNFFWWPDSSAPNAKQKVFISLVANILTQQQRLSLSQQQNVLKIELLAEREDLVFYCHATCFKIDRRYDFHGAPHFLHFIISPDNKNV